MASLAPKSGPLGRRLAAHLLRRATFGPTRPEIDSLSTMTASQAVDSMMVFPPLPAHPVDPQTGQTWLLDGRGANNSSEQDLKFIIGSWWLHQLFDPAIPLTIAHKLFFFLHTSFVTGRDVISYSENHYYMLRLLMYYVPGSYKDLAKKVPLDNGMNEFLNIGDSIKGSPNENFAREFFELYTIGKGTTIGPGNYGTFTEQDVKASARLLTGFQRQDIWNDPLLYDPDTGLPRCSFDIGNHDPTDKVYSTAFGGTIITGQNTALGMEQEIGDLVDMIFAQDAASEHIMRRLYRYFVNHHISAEAEADVIKPLAAEFRNNNFELKVPLGTLLKSEHFYDADDALDGDEVVGALIKGPLEMQIGMNRYFSVPVPDPAADPFLAYITYYKEGLQDAMDAACLDLFKPDDVAGYWAVFQGPEYQRLWVTAKSVGPRYQMSEDLLFGPPELQTDLLVWVQDSNNISDFNGPDAQGNPGPHAGARIGSHLVAELLDYLLPEAVDQIRFDYFLNDLLLDNLGEINWLIEWDLFVQNNDPATVLPRLKILVKGILQSSEYNLS